MTCSRQHTDCLANKQSTCLFKMGETIRKISLDSKQIINSKDKPNVKPDIGLTDVDSRIFLNILAKRLEGYLLFLIRPDQTSLIKNRHSFTKMKKLLIKYTYTNQTQGPECRMALFVYSFGKVRPRGGFHLLNYIDILFV